MHNFSHYR